MPRTKNGQIKFLAVIVLLCGVSVTFVTAGLSERVLSGTRAFGKRSKSSVVSETNVIETHEVDTDLNMDTNVFETYDIETGYEKTDNITIKKDKYLQDHLMCTYMINSFHHLRLTQELLDSSVDLKQTVETIIMYDGVSQEQVISYQCFISLIVFEILDIQIGIVKNMCLYSLLKTYSQSSERVPSTYQSLKFFPIILLFFVVFLIVMASLLTSKIVFSLQLFSFSLNVLYLFPNKSKCNVASSHLILALFFLLTKSSSILSLRLRMGATW